NLCAGRSAFVLIFHPVCQDIFAGIRLVPSFGTLLALGTPAGTTRAALLRRGRIRPRLPPSRTVGGRVGSRRLFRFLPALRLQNPYGPVRFAPLAGRIIVLYTIG